MDTTFLFDVGSPYAWLAAERLETVLGAAPVVAGEPYWGDDQLEAAALRL
jgi:2-hydroxychromene-2-carboxylate isomerase